MRMRIISAAVVLGLGLVGIALAQQAGEGRRDDKAKLRVQVAKLRAEVEIRQLEHDADADILKKLMVDMKNVECMEASKGPMKEQAEALLKGPLKGEMEALKGAANGLLLPPPGPLPDLREEFNKMFSADEAVAKAARPLLERLKKEFVQKSAELNEKRLELAEVETRYNEAR
jgi:hypothetical protein